MTIKQMQNNIIGVLGFEHPTTIEFFRLCEQLNSFIDIIYDEYINIIESMKILCNDYNCAHIHCNVVDGYTDDIIKVIAIEISGKQYTKFTDINKDICSLVCNSSNDYINIIDIIIE